MLFSHGTPHSKGVIILVKDNLEFEQVLLRQDPDGRFILLDCKIQDQPFVLLNVYAPTKVNDQIEFFDSVTKMLEEFVGDKDTHNIIIGGDFNICFDRDFDCKGGTPIVKKSVTNLKNLMLSLDLIDIWRIRNTKARRFTWRQKTPLIQRRLDFWLISDSIQEDVEHTDIKPAIKTDHSAISLNFNTIGHQSHGPSHWKFNSSLTEDPEYVKLINDAYPLWLNEFSDVEDKRVLWDLVKYKIRQTTMKYSKEIAKARREKITAIEKKLKEAEKNCDVNPSEETMSELAVIKTEYEQMLDHITTGMIVRSRANWYEKGEKNNKYFLNLENRKKSKSCVRKLKSPNSEIIDPKLILEKLESFYSDLYSNNDASSCVEITEDFMSNISIPRLSNEAQLSCEGVLSQFECYNAVKEFANNKSPGCDGLTAEFYKTFWPLVGKQLVETLNYSYVHGELSTSQKQATITLIEKKDKDKRYIPNWRPISLLNVDAKITSKVLAKRLQKVLPNIIHNNQFAYIKGRSISDAVRNIHDIMEFTKDENLPGLLVALDFEKAFDSLSWKFLFNALERFNFGPSFISWVRTLYNNACSCIMNNGFASNYFSIKRGVRQGDPLSAYLFIIALEVLLTHIREDSSISGIMIGSKEVKLCAFADDLTCLLEGKASYINLLRTTNIFSLCSGLKLNKKKTDVLWLGKKRNCSEALPDLEISETPVKVLGIYFTYNKHKKKELNFDKILKDVKKTLAAWKWRNLTLFGRIQIVKTFAIPKIMYRASLIQIDKETIKEANTHIYNFIWNGKDKIKRLALINNYENGGLKAPHLESLIQTQRAQIINRFLDDENLSMWKTILHENLSKVGSTFLFQCNFDVDKLPVNLPLFYDECIRSWRNLNSPSTTPTNRSDILSETIWNNQHICIDGKSVYIARLAHRGIVRLSDILSHNGLLRNWKDTKKQFPFLSVSDYFRLGGIVNSFPTLWKIVLRSYNMPGLTKSKQANVDKSRHKNNSNNLPSNKIYWNIVSTIALKPTAQAKFQKLYHDFDFNWKEIYCRPYKTTIDCKTREFQYKILNRILYTNKILCKMKITDSPLCSFCNEYDESLEHLLYRCTFVKDFWLSIVQWFSTIVGYTINSFKETDIVFGFWNNSNEIRLLNHIILLGLEVIKD